MTNTYLSGSTHMSRSRARMSDGKSGKSSKNFENVRSFPSKWVWNTEITWFTQVS